jgi:hypothetical protein
VRKAVRVGTEAATRSSGANVMVEERERASRVACWGLKVEWSGGWDGEAVVRVEREDGRRVRVMGVAVGEKAGWETRDVRIEEASSPVAPRMRMGFGGVVIVLVGSEMVGVGESIGE